MHSLSMIIAILKLMNETSIKINNIELIGGKQEIHSHATMHLSLYLCMSALRTIWQPRASGELDSDLSV